MKFTRRGKALFFVCLFFIWMSSQTVFAKDNETAFSGRVLKVGYTLHDQMIKQDGDGNHSGYGVEYLEHIAEYTGWQYEYILVEEDERYTKLINGEIDITCNAHLLKQYKNILCYSDAPSGIEYSLLCTRKDNNELFYNEYKSLNQKKIGINVNSNLEETLIQYGIRYNFKYESVYFNEFEEMYRALDNGEIDAMLASSLRDLETYKYIGKVGIQNEYFATSQKQHFLMYSLNVAMEQIQLKTPFYSNSLYEKYYGIPNQTLNGMTKAEYDLISSGKIFKVAYDRNGYPLEYFDEETKTYKGIYADALKLIEEQSGLTFEYVPVNNIDDIDGLLKDNKVDLVSHLYDCTTIQNDKHTDATVSYLEEEYALVCRKGDERDANYTIALPLNSIGLEHYLRENQSESNAVSYPTVEDCLKAVAKKEVSAAMINTVYLQTVYSLDSYENLMMLPGRSLSVPISVGIGNQDTELLKSILTKAIYAIPKEKFDKCIVENVINIKYIPSLLDSVRGFLPQILSASVAILLIGFVLIKNRERYFRHLAMSDSVTGLWNGVKFRQEGNQLLNKNKQTYFTILSLDIDRFKFVNNDFGQSVADNILMVLGTRIKKAFGKDAICARDMADMFLIMTESCDNIEEIMESLSEEVYFENNGKPQRYKMSLKCGIVIALEREEEQNITSYIDKANSARKSIKGLSSAHISYYNQAMEESIEYELSIERNMEAALYNREFHVYYQPKYDLNSERITGAEALVRWMSPTKGLISPDSFISIFEKNGFIVNLDFYVYEEVMRNMAKWKKEGRTPICISINVSRVHITTPDFLPRLLGLTEEYGIEHKYLELELTETILGTKKTAVLSFINACKAAGFLISIDDFGSGYSSLNLLKELPVDILKIDKGFLDEVEDSERSSIIVEQVVVMARKIKIGTLCEGVETKKQADFLKHIGCDMAQGFLYSQPIPIEEFEAML